MKRWQWVHKLLATGFGAGYSPVAPGTAGAVVALVIIGLMQHAGIFSHIHYSLGLGILILVFLTIGVKVSNLLETYWGKDPSKIVIDEMVGVWIALLFTPYGWKIIISGFVLFRIFDIWKPLGIRRMENLPGGWGVMMDDVVAGVYSNLVLQVILFTGWLDMI